MVVDCGFWRRAGEFRVVFVGISYFLFFFFSSDAVLVWGVFDVFCFLCCVLVGFLLVIMVKKCKWWVLENIR